MSIKCQKHQRQELMKERIELGPENGKLAKDAKIRLKAYIKLIERGKKNFITSGGDNINCKFTKI